MKRANSNNSGRQDRDKRPKVDSTVENDPPASSPASSQEPSQPVDIGFFGKYDETKASFKFTPDSVLELPGDDDGGVRNLSLASMQIQRESIPVEDMDDHLQKVAQQCEEGQGLDEDVLPVPCFVDYDENGNRIENIKSEPMPGCTRCLDTFSIAIRPDAADSSEIEKTAHEFFSEFFPQCIKRDLGLDTWDDTDREEPVGGSPGLSDKTIDLMFEWMTTNTSKAAEEAIDSMSHDFSGSFWFLELAKSVGAIIQGLNKLSESSLPSMRKTPEEVRRCKKCRGMIARSFSAFFIVAYSDVKFMSEKRWERDDDSD